MLNGTVSQLVFATRGPSVRVRPAPLFDSNDLRQIFLQAVGSEFGKPVPDRVEAMTKPDPSVKPKYRQRKGRSNGFVEYKGKRITIPGAYGSEEGRANYEQWLENVFYKDGLPRYEPVSKPESLNVSQLLLKYLRYAKSAISDSEFSHTKVVLRIMHQQFAAIAIVDFGPKRLKLLQEALVRRGNARSQVNSQIRRVLTMFEWGVSEELVKVDVLQALRTV
ncbi:MAG TPA: hypothetical protein DCE55_29220, partial [Planctomycetaceae bacterium]|nr:hypothetical protein [Planctomycetaceae bacterium]